VRTTTTSDQICRRTPVPREPTTAGTVRTISAIRPSTASDASVSRRVTSQRVPGVSRNARAAVSLSSVVSGCVA
jgi:hypothetical protein